MLLCVILLSVLKHTRAFDKDFVASKYFVDKTPLLKVLFDEDVANHNYITGPVGFGKTTNIEMIRKFCEVEFDRNGNLKPWQQTESYELFKNLKVFQDTSIVNDHLAQHAVVHLQLNFVFDRETDEKKILDSFNARLAYPYKKYKHVLKDFLRNASRNDPMLKLFDKADILKLQRADIPNFLTSLCDALYNRFDHKSVIVLIDEFDHTINQGSAPLKILDYVYGLIHTMLKQLVDTLDNKVNVLMSGISGLPFRYYSLVKCLKIHYFSETNIFTSFFGILPAELEDLFDRYECDSAERYYIKEYYAPYNTVDQKHQRYSSYSIGEYFGQRNGSSLTFPKLPYGAVHKQTFIPSFLKDPQYLDKIAKMFKFCPIRGIFKHRHDHKAIKSFPIFIAHDFGNNDLPFRSILYTFSIEQGFFAPISENTYVIPNYEIRSRLVTYLRHHFEDRLKIDLKKIAFYLREILSSPEDQIAHLKGLQEVLGVTFGKLKTFQEFGCTMEYTHQLVIHIAAMTQGELRVVEDYPLPILYNETTISFQRRCVTAITFEDTALVVKMAYKQSLHTALYKAMAYPFTEHGITRVKNLGVYVRSKNVTRVSIGTKTLFKKSVKDQR